jgi:hypothetical protein
MSITLERNKLRTERQLEQNKIAISVDFNILFSVEPV